MFGTRVLAPALAIACSAGVAQAFTVSFTAADVKAAMLAAGAPLSNATDQWGLWAVRARPVVGGNGIFTMGSAATTQTGWGALTPSSYAWPSPYGTNCAWFYDYSGSEAGSTAANPLYMVMDVPDTTFWSYAFDKSGSYVDRWSPGGGGTFYASGYDSGFGGTNVVTAASDSASYSFDFSLDPGATWNGGWEFVVDGSRYSKGTYGSPGGWQEDFWGGFGANGGLSGNTGHGYAATTSVPEPFTMALCGAGLGLALLRRKRKA